MEGLDISVRTLSDVRFENKVFRFDSGYFSKAALEAERAIKKHPWSPLLELSHQIESFGAYALTNEFTYVEEGIPFLRCLNVRKGFTEFSDVLHISPEANLLLGKSEVLPEMVLLTMSGSVGNASVALPTWKYPINSNQDVAKILTKRDLSPYYLTAFFESRFGQIQMEKLPVGSVQQHIFLWMIERLPIPRLKCEQEIAGLVKTAYALAEEAERHLATAEDILIDSLSFRSWQAPESLSYTQRACTFMKAGRYDAEFFYPAKIAAMNELKRTAYKLVGELYYSARDVFDPLKADPNLLVRNFDVTDALNPVLDDSKLLLKVGEIGSIKKIFQKGDVAISRLRSYLREIAVVRTSNEPLSVGSSEFIVLRPIKETEWTLSPEALMIFLRSKLVQTILKWSQDGSNHPRFGEEALLTIPVPYVVIQQAPYLNAAVNDSLKAREQARVLLNRAKRAVEIAIEQNEAAALRYLSLENG